MKTKSKKGPSEKDINAVILKTLIDKYGTPIGKEDAEELGIDEDGPVKGLDLYHGDGLSYYDKFNKETVYVWAIYLDRKNDVRVAFWHDPGKTDEPSDDAEFHCGDPSDFAAWEINLIAGEISEWFEKGIDAQTEKAFPFVCIVVFGQYNCKDAVDSTRSEMHTIDEWKNIFKGHDCMTEVHRFATEAERDAFAAGVRCADNYFSGDFYTAVPLTERIIDAGPATEKERIVDSAFGRFRISGWTAVSLENEELDFALPKPDMTNDEITDYLNVLKEEHNEEIRSQITSALVGNHIDKAPELLGAYGNVSFVDEKIDDGCDGPEDNYVMMRSYDVGDLYVRLYYGDVTRTIATVDVQ